MTIARCFLVAGLAGLLTACVSMEYGTIGPERPYGYKETRRDDGSYVLTIAHPDPKQAILFWDQRAEELCQSKTYVKNIYQAIRPTVWTPGYSAFAGVPYLEGYLTCGASQPPALAASSEPPVAQSGQ
jgi:hypothetical protein